MSEWVDAHSAKRLKSSVLPNANVVSSKTLSHTPQHTHIHTHTHRFLDPFHRSPRSPEHPTHSDPLLQNTRKSWHCDRSFVLLNDPKCGVLSLVTAPQFSWPSHKTLFTPTASWPEGVTAKDAERYMRWRHTHRHPMRDLPTVY